MLLRLVSNAGKERFTGDGGYFFDVPFRGTMSFSSLSIGSSNVVSCHQTEPLPSIMPFPLIVIPLSFVNSSHCNRPLPQALEFVGAIMVPSSWKRFNTLASENKHQFFEYQFWCNIHIYLEQNVCFTIRTREGYGPHEEDIIWWHDDGWCLDFTSSCPCSLECLRCTVKMLISFFFSSSCKVNIFIFIRLVLVLYRTAYNYCRNPNLTAL